MAAVKSIKINISTCLDPNTLTGQNKNTLEWKTDWVRNTVIRLIQITTILMVLGIINFIIDKILSSNCKVPLALGLINS